MRRRGVASIATALALASFMVACGDDSGSTTSTTGAGGSGEYPAIPDGPITFGVSAPLSGGAAAFGLATQKSFEEVTLKTFNAMHPDGIDGHEVRVVVLDDASDVTRAVSVANQMVADKMAAVVTVSYNPAAAPQQLAILNKAKVPVLATQSLNEYADTTKWPYLFNMGPSAQQNADVTAEWIAKHPEIEKIAVLTDGTPSQTEILDNLTAALKKTAPGVDMGTKQSITPGATNVSTAIAQLKKADPDLLFINVGFGFGAIWQGIEAATWSPQILVGAGAWYDGFDAMGALAERAVANYYECAVEGHPPFNDALKTAMDGYVAIFGTSTTNFLTFVTTDNGPLELLKAAIEMHHSVDPDAIKHALETMGSFKVLDTVEYQFSADNHSGVTGTWGPAVCKMAPTIDGPYRIPEVAP